VKRLITITAILLMLLATLTPLAPVNAEEAELPVKVDLSQDKYFPPVGGQGDQGACIAFACTYYQFTYQMARLMDWDASEQEHIFSARWTYNYINGGRNSGANYRPAYELMKNHGVATNADFPFEGGNTLESFANWPVTAEVYRNALQYRVTDYTYTQLTTDRTEQTPITGPDSPCLQAAKQYLATGYPLAITTDYGAWKKVLVGAGRSAKEVVTHVEGRSTAALHAVAIVGYDDEYWFDLNDDGEVDEFEKGAFLVVNSYGPTWNNDGFIWVPYDALNQVSNTDDLNGALRSRFLYDNGFYTIEVGYFEPRLTCEVTLRATNRSKLRVSLAEFIDGEPAEGQIAPFLKNIYANLPFDANSEGAECEGTFVFDFGPILTEGWEDREWCVIITDNGNDQTESTVVSIKFFYDDNVYYVIKPENVLVKDSAVYSGPGKPVRGDVDYDLQANIDDILALRDHIFGLREVELHAGDLSGDGMINIEDIMILRGIIFGE